ncbi:MAG: transcriptional repressor NrdR [Clostridia bacterium]|nr:transcriptional repressor NrdR [Clostridia bacterium]
MKCPHCGYTESKVLDSRPADEGACIRRRRECLSCQTRFTTYERLEAAPLVVVKKDGSRQAFDRAKLLNGIVRACEKRPVALAEMERLVDDIEARLRSNMENEVSSGDIGEMVMEGLKGIDEVAYVRFASVYREFKDINTFMGELKVLLKEQEKTGKTKKKQ